MELHGAIYIFKLVIGGDMALQRGTLGHAGAASTFFCFICDMARHNKHLTRADYQRKGHDTAYGEDIYFCSYACARFRRGVWAK
jgi:hypothetical protein